MFDLGFSFAVFLTSLSSHAAIELKPV